MFVVSVHPMEGIVCKGLSKSYDGKTYALNSVSLDFPDKGIIAMIGRNGAGKTTLIRILATELMPSKGSVSINGIDVVKEPAKMRDMIAIVPQEARAIPWLTPHQTILCYLLYRGFGYGEAVKRVKESLRKLDFTQYENKLQPPALRRHEAQGARCHGPRLGGEGHIPGRANNRPGSDIAHGSLEAAY